MDLWSASLAKFHLSPLHGEKSIFVPLSECSTGMAALHAGLPVTDIQKNHTFSSTAGMRRTIPTILGTVIEEVSAIFAPLYLLRSRSVVLPLRHY